METIERTRVKKVDRRKYPRFIKRLTARFCIDEKSFIGISSDLSKSGLFIRTNRGLTVNSPIDIEILLPDNRVSFLKGIVRRTTRTLISSMKNGMGIEIIEKDGAFVDFIKSLIGEGEENIAEKQIAPELQKISSLDCDMENKDSRNTMQDRRRHKRFKVEQLSVNGEMPSASEVNIINISLGGVLVKADRRLNIGNKYALKIGYKDKILFAKTLVIWSSLLESLNGDNGNIVPLYIAGMQFTDTSHEKIEEIINLVESIDFIY